MKKVLMVPAGTILPDDKLGPDTLCRCQAASLLAAYNSGYDYLLLTGGCFVRGQSISAALLMKQWFLSRGYSARMILTEETSVDSFNNMKYGLEILDNKLGVNNYQLTVVSHWPHLLRIWLTTYRGYGTKILLYPLICSVSVKAIVQEFFFLLYHFFDPQGKGWLARYNRSRRRKIVRLSLMNKNN